MSEITTRAYELGFILAPTAPETEVPSLVDALKEAITKAEGEILSEGAPEFIDLAYTMEKTIASKKLKYSQGYFGWIKFTALPEQMESIKKTLDGMAALVRYILIKTNVENAVVFKKPKVEAKRGSTEEGEITFDESEEDELKEDHELLPDVASDIESAPDTEADTTEEPEEKESE